MGNLHCYPAVDERREGLDMGLREEIMGISHLGLKTENLQASEKWYEEKLNFQKVLEAVRVMPQMEKISWMAYKNVLLELVEPAGREKEELKNQAAGKWDHYALEVPMLEESVRKAVGKGMTFHSSTADGITVYEHLGASGVWGANFNGPGREVVEFCTEHGKYQETASGEQAGMGLAGWSHLALKVEDLKRSMVFYEKLGFTECGGGYLETPEGRIQIRYMENHGFQLEILQMIGSDLTELKMRHGGPIAYAGLLCEDIEKTFLDAKAEKLPLSDFVIREKELPGARKARLFGIIGPDGEKIEINQKISSKK